MRKFLLIVVFSLMSGALYQFVSTIIDDAKYPPPGRLVDIGGYKLHMHVSGKSSGPTVVLEAGGGCNSLHFSLVQREIEKFARVVSYDRAGFGWSDPSPKLRTSKNMVEELHQLLQTAKIPGPYVLVGHSFGGMNVQLYTSQYPEEVLGIVLVDAVHVDQPYTLPHSEKLLKWSLQHPVSRTLIQIGGGLGVFRLFNVLSRPNKFPPDIYEIILAKSYSTKFFNTALEEYIHFQESQKQGKQKKQEKQEKKENQN